KNHQLAGDPSSRSSSEHRTPAPLVSKSVGEAQGSGQSEVPNLKLRMENGQPGSPITHDAESTGPIDPKLSDPAVPLPANQEQLNDKNVSASIAPVQSAKENKQRDSKPPQFSLSGAILALLIFVALLLYFRLRDPWWWGSFIAWLCLTFAPWAIVDALAFMYLGFFLCWQFGSTMNRHLPRDGIFVGIGLAIVSFFFGMVGVLVEHHDLPLLSRMSMAVYESTQLPLMNMWVHDAEDRPAAAQAYFTWARFFASMLAIYLTYRTLTFLTNRASAQFWLRWYRVPSRRRVNLVIGLGEIGGRIACKLRERHQRVIGLECDSEKSALREIRRTGVRVMIDNALDSHIYRDLPLNQIKRIYVVTGDDQRNLEVTHRVIEEIHRRAEFECSMQEGRKSDEGPIAYWLRLRCVTWMKIFCDERNIECLVQLYDRQLQDILWIEKDGQPCLD
ncbi:MAG: NAD-binding protein, partial [Planctomycetota bacterium]